MSKKTHFSNADNGVLCGAPVPKAYAIYTANARYRNTRHLKTTNNPNRVTCERCRDKLAEAKAVFVCPVCKAASSEFLVVESLIVTSRVNAKNRGRRYIQKQEDRKLIKIICPLCKTEIPENEDWKHVSTRLKLSNV